MSCSHGQKQVVFVAGVWYMSCRKRLNWLFAKLFVRQSGVIEIIDGNL